MAAKEPQQRLIECLLVTAGMVLTFLMLTRDKIFMALLVALFFFGVLVRFKRSGSLSLSRKRTNRRVG